MSSYFKRTIAKKIKDALTSNNKTLTAVNLDLSWGKTTKLFTSPKIDVMLNLQIPNDVNGLEDTDIKCLQSLTPGEINLVQSFGQASVVDIEVSQHQKKKSSHLRIHLCPKQYVQKQIQCVLQAKDKYGCNPVSMDQQQKVIVEYSSPNIAKLFHAGHLRSTIIGNIIANLYEAKGHKVIRINYLGDWGAQFGLLCRGYEKYGDEKQLSEDSIKHLYDVYVKIQKDVSDEEGPDRDNKMSSKTREEGLQISSLLENGDPTYFQMWKRFKDLSIEEYKRVYQKLGVKYDVYEGESNYVEQSRELMERLAQENVIREKSDTKVKYIEYDDVKNPSKKYHASVQRSDGTSLYLTRDIAAAITRLKNHKFDKMHYIVEDGQKSHFKSLAGILLKIDNKWKQITEDNFHVTFGRVAKMSTRHGTVVLLSDILSEAKSHVIKSIQDADSTKIDKHSADLDIVADVLTNSVLIINETTNPRRKPINFKWENFTLSNKAVSLQYAHARLCSLLSSHTMSLEEVDLSSLSDDPSALKLIIELDRYEHNIQNALDKLEPFIIVDSLSAIVGTFGTAYEQLQLKNQQGDILQARLQLFNCTRMVLANGLKLLGITPLEKM